MSESRDIWKKFDDYLDFTEHLIGYFAFIYANISEDERKRLTDRYAKETDASFLKWIKNNPPYDMKNTVLGWLLDYDFEMKEDRKQV